MPKSTFARSVGVLVGGTAGAQILLLVAAPLLTRLYTPEDFGLLAVYGSLLTIISVVTSLRYELAIPLPKDDNEAENLVMLCLILVVTISALTGVAMFLWGDSIAKKFGVPALANYLWLLPLGALLTGFYTVFNYWGIRTKRFGDIAKTKLSQSLATLAIQLAGFKLGGIALLLGQVAGQTAGTLTLAIPTLKIIAFKQLSLTKMKLCLLRYKEFPLYSTWSGLINTAGHQLPPLIFAAFFSAGAAGLYALANRLLAIPANLIGGALAQVFMSHGVDRHREGNLDMVYAKLQNSLLQIGIPPTLLIILVGPELFVTVFGEKWQDAGVFTQWLAVSSFFGFVVAPLSQVFTILEKERIGIILQLFLFMTRFIGIMIGVLLDSLITAIMLFSFGGALGYIAYIYYGARLSGCSMKETCTEFIKVASKSTLIMSPFLIGYLSASKWMFATFGFASLVLYILQLRTLTGSRFS